MNGDKGYEYGSMPYQWPYHHHPYYMPPTQPTITAQQDQTISKAGSTNININFPMYMCPPPHNYSAPSRYPQPNHPSYLNYDYPPPYPQSHLPAPHNSRDLAPLPPNPAYQGHPPQMYQNHYHPPYQNDKKNQNAHHSFHPSLPTQAISHQGYHPNMHHYQQYFPSLHGQHQNPSSKF